MKRSTRQIFVGVISSLFLSPLVGGGIAGYLSGTDIRRGVKVGGIVGVIVGILISSIAILYLYYGIYQPLFALSETAPESMGPGATMISDIIWPKLLALALFFGGSIVTGLIGGGIGSYIAAHRPATTEQPSSIS